MGWGGDDRTYTYPDKSRNSVDILLISDDRLGHLSDTQSNGPRCVAFQFDHLVGTYTKEVQVTDYLKGSLHSKRNNVVKRGNSLVKKRFFEAPR